VALPRQAGHQLHAVGDTELAKSVSQVRAHRGKANVHALCDGLVAMAQSFANLDAKTCVEDLRSRSRILHKGQA